MRAGAARAAFDEQGFIPQQTIPVSRTNVPSKLLLVRRASARLVNWALLGKDGGCPAGKHPGTVPHPEQFGRCLKTRQRLWTTSLL